MDSQRVIIISIQLLYREKDIFRVNSVHMQQFLLSEKFLTSSGRASVIALIYTRRAPQFLIFSASAVVLHLMYTCSFSYVLCITAVPAAHIKQKLIP